MRFYVTLTTLFGVCSNKHIAILRRIMLGGIFCLGLFSMGTVLANDVSTGCAVQADSLQQQIFQVDDSNYWLGLSHLLPQAGVDPITDFYCRECRKAGCSSLWCLPCCPP